MSKKKTDDVYTNFYEPYLKDNPSNKQQALTENMYIRMLTELCANRFKWIGLPDTVDERFLELNLFWRALCVFYWDKDYDRFMALTASGSGMVNMYDNPTTFTVTGSNMINKTLNAKECVPIWANYLRVPDLDIVRLYSVKLANLDRTIEILVQAMRYTTVVHADENERQSYVNALRQWTEGQPIIFGNNGLDIQQNVSAFNVAPHPEALPNLLIAKTKMWNECMTLLGINNANQDKKERLVSDEVGANNDQVLATRAIALNARQQAAYQINRIWKDLDVRVEFNSETPQMPSFAQGLNGDESLTDMGEVESGL